MRCDEPEPMTLAVAAAVADDRDRIRSGDRAHYVTGGRAMHAIVHSLDLTVPSAVRTMRVLGNRRALPLRVPSTGPEAGRRSSEQGGHCPPGRVR